MSDPIRALLLRTQQPSRGMAWHGGPTPPEAVRGVDAAHARWRPRRGGHSIWELALHVAYWDYTVRRRVLGVPLPRFPRTPANFPSPPRRSDEAAWAADRDLLAEQHGLLTELLADFPTGRLAGRMGRGRWTYGDTLLGIILHDAYHAGQIQLLKRMQGLR